MVLGIILSGVAAILFGISIAIQKYSLNTTEKFSLKIILRNTKWMGAVAVGFVGVLTYVVALNLENISTVQPIASANIIITILAGFLFFKEKLEVKKWLFLVLTVIGIFLVSLS